MLRPLLCAPLLVVLLAACGEPTVTPGVATNPVVSGPGTTPATGSSVVTSGVRTVLSPLGLNIHTNPQLSAAVVGTAAQGTELTVLDHTDASGGWYKVAGQTQTGWIVADPALTADGHFTAYSSTTRNVSALYPQTWTFAEQPADALFYPLSGPQTIVVRNGAHVADFGPSGATGFVGSGQQTVIVCGVTANLDLFSNSNHTLSSPTPGTAAPLALLAQVRLTLDATHALALDFNYTTAADLTVFADFYNSMTFPYPQCEAPAPSASPT